MSTPFGTILESIGGTPLVRLRRVADAQCATILAKLESANPSGTVKDRAALAMVEAAEGRGEVGAGATLVMASSGNIGISLAMVAAAKGYRALIVLPESAPVERRRLLRRYGAQLHLTPAFQGMSEAIRVAQGMAKEARHVLFDPFSDPSVVEAHRRTTAQEVLEQTGGTVHAFVAGVGTGGTITGVGQVLKEKNGKTAVVAVEPAASPLLSQGRAGAHGIVGLGADFVPPILDRRVIDEVMTVADQEAIEMMYRLAKEEGILAGISSGANVAAALVVARRLGPGKAVVTVLPDTGERYRVFSP